MDWEEGIDTLDYTIEQQEKKEIEDKRFSLYTSIYPLIITNQINKVSYEKFVDILEGKSVNEEKSFSTNKSNEEIEKEIEELERLEKLKKGGK